MRRGGRRLPPRLHLRVHPELRNDVLERSDCDEMVTFYSSLSADFDREGVSAVEQLGVLGILRRVLTQQPQVLEVPEPLWTKHWPKQVVLLSVLRLARSLPAGRRPLLIAYAIENAAPAERLSLPFLDRRPLFQKVWLRLATLVWGWSISLLDLMVFGTPAAARNYQQSFPSALRRVRQVLIPDSLAECSTCKLPPFLERPPMALFVGELSARKGVDVLLDAWRFAEESGILPQKARLVLVGDGPLAPHIRQSAAGMDDVDVLGLLGRSAVHDLLRRARVVVLPSRRVRRWREQIGISLLEGEAHLCNLLTTSESGLALSLAERSGALVVAPEDVPGLARSIAASLSGQLTRPRPQDGRAALEQYVHEHAAGGLAGERT